MLFQSNLIFVFRLIEEVIIISSLCILQVYRQNEVFKFIDNKNQLRLDIFFIGIFLLGILVEFINTMIRTIAMMIDGVKSFIKWIKKKCGKDDNKVDIFKSMISNSQGRSIKKKISDITQRGDRKVVDNIKTFGYGGVEQECYDR